jgi:hypothetical protein
MSRLGISTGRFPRNVGKPCFQWFRIDNAIRLDGGVIKIKALLGVRSNFPCLISYSNVRGMQENQLYIFDPKALHQIIVKVRFFSLDYRSHSRPMSQDQHIYEETTSFIEYPLFLLSWTPVHWNPIPRINKLVFGPGLVATLGEHICSSNQRNVEEIFS